MNKINKIINKLKNDTWCYSYHDYNVTYEYDYDILDNIIIIKTSY